uniref:Uncharacterized protein n=1 Tax=Graphocephala atropunctata TaxID=36148 RepID=A0A1B6M7I3_9HEMI
MSDTDDTDLLLLIPPDFYLIESPDLSDIDSDCDVGFEPGPNDVKDAIVSDLITQVNDLESRICMIESFDRSATHCSTCNEDSFANQSVNSLTESDVLRCQIKGSSKLSIDKPMLGSIDQVISSDSEPLVQELLTGLENKSSEKIPYSEYAKSIVVNNTTEQDIDGSYKTEEQQILTVKECYKPDVACKRSQEELLNEVDSFLGVKRKHKLTEPIFNKEYGNKEVENFPQGRENVLPYTTTDELLNSEQKECSSDLECQQEEQSLALPEVYELLKEMEETQYEIERKLKIHQFQPNHQSKDNVESAELRNRQAVNSSKLLRLKTLELEDLYRKPPPNSLGNKQIEKDEQFRHIQGKRHQMTSGNSQQPIMEPSSQVSYLYKPTFSSLNEEIQSYNKESKFKSASPIRTSGNHNLIDVVRANLPRNESQNIISRESNKQSPRKLSGFRRQLNFQGPDFSLKSSKSRSSVNVEQNKNNQSDIHENDRLQVDFIHRTNRNVGGSNQSLEDHFKAIALQRATTNTNPEANFVSENILSSHEIPQEKISSNKLLSLSELWNKEPTFYSDDPNKLRQKLEEEKYRRQHCEQQIQVLQLRVLEEQEKLAVAIRVDQEKDKAIVQITESWRKLNSHWGELEEQRHSLAQQLQEERESAKVKSNELTKKIERWEKEVSQALDLAADYKEKSETVQNQMEMLKKDTEEKLTKMKTELQNLNQENTTICDENTNLLKQIESFQERLKEEEDLLSKLKNELEKSNKQVQEQEAEMCVIKDQKENVSLMLKEERNRYNLLEQRNIALQQTVNEAAKREKAAEEEVRVSTERVEVARTELRAFYQGQLETVVKEKLQEFQGQLEAAEMALKTELQLKEREWAERTSEQYKQLKEKCKKDLQTIEESRREEVNKWKVKLMESERLRSFVESKLQEETNRRGDIAQRLHSVMETQWREALNIISNPMQFLRILFTWL